MAVCSICRYPLPALSRLLLLLALVCLGPAALAGEADDPAELDRTWRHAQVFLPDASPSGYRSIPAEALAEALAARAERLPVVVYAHGCAGLGRASTRTGQFLARAGYLVVAPDSFARADKPASCDPSKRRGGLHRGVLAWRQAEVGHAIAEVGGLPNTGTVFLMGFSEGGITAATYRGLPVAGRIIEGWTCHAGWPEYRGLNAPLDEPVLAFVAARDPWFKLPVLQGDCGAFMEDRPDSRSVVVRDPPELAVSHWVSKDSGIQAQILAFLQARRG